MDSNEFTNIASIKRFSVDYSIDGERFKAKITVKESKQHGHRIYSIELLELENIKEEPTSNSGKPATKSQSTPQVGSSKHTVSQEQQNNNKQDENVAKTSESISDVLETNVEKEKTQTNFNEFLNKKVPERLKNFVNYCYGVLEYNGETQRQKDGFMNLAKNLITLDNEVDANKPKTIQKAIENAENFVEYIKMMCDRNNKIADARVLSHIRQLQNMPRSIYEDLEEQDANMTKMSQRQKTKTDIEAEQQFNEVNNIIKGGIGSKDISDTQMEEAIKSISDDKSLLDTINKLPKSTIEKSKRDSEKIDRKKNKNANERTSQDGAFANIDLEQAEDEFFAVMGIEKRKQEKAFNIVDDSDVALEAALQEARKELSKLSANPMFNPNLHKALFKVGAIYLQRGANNFVTWAKQMEQTLGEKARPWLGSVWKSIEVYPKNEKVDDEKMAKAVAYVGKLYDGGFNSKSKLMYELERRAGSKENFEKLRGIFESTYAGIDELYNPTMNIDELLLENNIEEASSNSDEKVVKSNQDSKIAKEAEELNAEIETNDKNQISIKFNGKPNEEFRDVMKKAGFKWNSKLKVWWAFQNEKSLQFAKEIGHEQEEENYESQHQSKRLERTLEGEQSERVQPIEKRGETSTESGRGSETAGQEVLRNSELVGSKQSENGQLRGSVQTEKVQRNDSEGTSERRDTPWLKPAQENNAKASEVPGHNFTITDETAIGDGGLKTKYRYNVEAIKLLKQLEAENRLATPKEQAILAKYVGWGGLASAFNIYNDAGKEWAAEQKELQELLTDDEYKAARKSTTTSFYTPPTVVKGVWKILERFGFNGGKVLEPSMGVGNFFGMMPENMRKKSTLNGVELDSISGRIAKKLYPKANIEVTGFEKTQYPDNFFDVVVSNVPFDNDIKPIDSKYNKDGYAIHNYFFAKAIEQVRPGGIVCFITSTATMDNAMQGTKLRRMLSDKADFIGAIRLPDTTFQKNANTQVTSDLIILQKRVDKKVGDYNHTWINRELSDVKTQQGILASINEYYKANPNMLIGKMEVNFQNALVQNGKGLNLENELKQRIEELPENIYTARKSTRNLDSIDATRKTFLAPSGMRDGSFMLQNDGKVYQNNNGTMEALPQRIQKIAVGFTQVRDSVKELLAAQIDVKTADAELDAMRKKLNVAYDSFVKKFGAINKQYNRTALQGDPEYGLVASIEKYEYDKKTKKEIVDKRAVFYERTVNAVQQVEKADNASDALSLSLANTGNVDIDYMAKLIGKSSEEVVNILDGVIFQNPITDGYETADEYLSGNVREKLETAERAAKANPVYQKNVEALKKVIPTDLISEEITVNLGTPWIPASDIEAFANELMESDRYKIVNVNFIPQIGTWSVKGGDYGQLAKSKWGTYRRPFGDVLDAALNQKTLTVYDTDSDGNKTINKNESTAAQQKVKEVQAKFKEWIWKDNERKERLVNYYNRHFNNWKLREYDGSHLTLPGYSAVASQLRDHQKNAVWRIMQRQNTLLAHCVGAGKTWTMQTAAMEMKRLGIANKPMFVIPNHMLAQFENEFREIYPNVKLLSLSSESLPEMRVTGSKKMSKSELETKVNAKRAILQSTLGRVATEDWDGIIISHNMFKRIPMSNESNREFIQNQIDEVEEAIIELGRERGNNSIVKQLEKTKSNLEDKITRLMANDNKDIVIPFEQLGIDQIFVDEADMFKNLFFATKMTRIAGLSNSSSERSMDMFVKTQYLTKVNGGRGVVFATGTPISNTLAEMFTMLRYLDSQGLKEKNLNYFDNWAATFATRETTVERSPDGQGYRTVEKFTSFNNLPELIKMFRKFADVKSKEDLNLDVPKLKGGKNTIVEVPTNDALDFYIKNTAKERAEKIRNRKVDPTEDNMLKLTGDLRKASLDIRLVDPTVPAEVAGGKIKAITDKIAEKYKETSDVLGTQIVFCDLSTPKASKDKIVESDDIDTVDGSVEKSDLTVYEEIKRQLIDKGIPTNEIAFIHDAKNKKQKEELFEKAKDGSVRVLIGSTEKMGAGTNIQKHLVALHHVDAPWRPRDIEQREGRILRQGNENKEVEIFNYVTKDSFDANMWEKLKNKATMINQAMSSDISQRSIEDADANVLSFAEVEALASGNPLMAERVIVQNNLTKYASLRGQYEKQRAKNKNSENALPAKIAKAKELKAQADADMKQRKDISGDKFSIKLKGNTIVKRNEAKATIEALAKDYNNTLGSQIGEIGGFKLRLKYVPAGGITVGADGKMYTAKIGSVRAEIVGNNTYQCEASLGSIEYAVMHAPDKKSETEDSVIYNTEKELKAIQEELNTPFKYEEEYNRLQKRLTEINDALNIGKDEANDSEQLSVEDTVVDTRAKDELIAEIKDSIPNAQDVTIDGNTTTITLKSGDTVTVNIEDRIILTDKQSAGAKQAHGKNAREAQGKIKISADDIDITLSAHSKPGTMYHEVMHLARKLFLTNTQNKSIDRYIASVNKSKKNTEEYFADMHRDWVMQGKSPLGKLFRTIKEGLARLKALLTDGIDGYNDAVATYNAMREVESGKVFEKGVQNKGYAGTNYLVTNNKITGETLVPIVDVSGYAKSNPRRSNVRIAIANALSGQKIEVYGEGSIGRVISLDDGKHLVYGGRTNARDHERAYRQKLTTAISDVSAQEDGSLKSAILSNAIYIEKRPNMVRPNGRNQHSDVSHWIDLFVPISNGDSIYCYRITAKALDNNAGKYEIGDEIGFYSIKKEVLASNYTNNGDSIGGKPSEISIAQLLKNVKDENGTGKPYVDENGKLNFEPDVEFYSVDNEEQPKRVSRQMLHSLGEKIVGKIYVGAKERSALGLYNANAKAGIVQGKGKIHQIASVIGMHLENEYKIAVGKANVIDEIINQVKEMYGAERASEFEALNRFDQVQLGVARFMRLYTFDRASAERNFPKYFKEFENLLKDNDELRMKVNDFTNASQTFNKQSLGARVMTSITDKKSLKKIRNWNDFKERASEMFHDWYTKWVDDKHPMAQVIKEIEILSGEDVDFSDNPYHYARMAQSHIAARLKMIIDGSGAKKDSAEHKAWYEALNEALNGQWKHDVSFKNIIDKVAEIDELAKNDKLTNAYLTDNGYTSAIDALSAYLISNRVLEIREKYPNYNAPVSQEDALMVVNTAPKGIKEAAELYYKFDENLVDVLHDSGMLSDDGWNGLKQYTRYCPMFRDFSDEDGFERFFNNMGGFNSYANLSNGIKALSENGSDRTIVDPIKSMLKMATGVLGKTEKNKVAQKFVRLSERSGIGRFIVPEPLVDNKQSADPKANVFTVWNNGKKQAFRTTKDVYDILTGDSSVAHAIEQIWGPFLSAGTTAAQTLRRGATSSPGFMLSNFWRDNFEAALNSKNGYVPFVTAIKGMRALQTDPVFKSRFLASGVGMASIYRSDESGLEAKVDELKGKTVWDKPGLSLIKHAWDIWEGIGELIENSPRAGEMLLALENSKDVFEASMDAKNLTLDFSRAGKVGRDANKTIPFFNAVIQGGDVAVRTIANNPTKALTNGALMAIAVGFLWALTNKEPWYEALTDEDKLNYIHFPLTDGKHLSLPLPNTYGQLFGGSVVATLEYMKNKDPKAMKKLSEEFVMDNTPSFVPAILRPMLEVYSNFDFHFQNDIVSKRYQQLPIEEQIGTNTSRVAVGVGRTFGVSPIKIEHLIRGYFGSAGIWVTRLTNVALDEKEAPERNLAETVGFDRFVKRDYYNSGYVNEWYELKHNLDSNHKAYDNGKQPAYMKGANEAARKISKIQSDIRLIKANEKISAEQKRKLLDTAQKKLSDMARTNVEKYSKYVNDDFVNKQKARFKE